MADSSAMAASQHLDSMVNNRPNEERGPSERKRPSVWHSPPHAIRFGHHTAITLANIVSPQFSHAPRNLRNYMDEMPHNISK